MGILLTRPVTDKDSHDGSDSKIIFGSSAMQGWRTGMEDAQSSILDVGNGVAFFGVFDGHGGFEVAKYCATHLHEEFVRSPELATGDVEGALKRAYIETDRMMGSEEGVKELTRIHKVGTQGPNTSPDDFDTRYVHPEGVGCTAVCAAIVNNVLYVANAGDSRCVLSRDGQAVEMSIDHKPSLEGECRRITEAGGFVVNGRVNGNLNLTRALGDQDYKRDSKLGPEKQIISGVPDVRRMELGPSDEFVLLACDGIWDCLSNQDAVEFVRAGLAQTLSTTPADADPRVSAVCERVLDRCLAPSASNISGCDNMSVTIAVLRQALPRLRALPVPEPAPAASASASSDADAESASDSAAADDAGADP
eukprot:m51a1_g4049 putative protein phosphatase 2c family protein (364) ;mRNA; r:694800-696652